MTLTIAAEAEVEKNTAIPRVDFLLDSSTEKSRASAGVKSAEITVDCGFTHRMGGRKGRFESSVIQRLTSQA